ncbi:MAG: hypothetical protein A4E28_02843 [Methanocella sp. PtaU1.Bin125]|nr:MAG: hypothetical protein A4E28_02843 [Methanocella sp. PtaU1.Bin125]
MPRNVLLREMAGKLRARLTPQVITLRPNGESKGNLLLSYLQQPFMARGRRSEHLHSNQWECHEIADVWNRFGYTVDVISWDNRRFRPAKKYDFFIDIHGNMERIAPLLSRDCIKILHITGSHWLFQNLAEFERLLALQRRKGATLLPRRLAEPSMGIEYADCAVLIGNDATRSTFDYASKPIYEIDVTAVQEFPYPESKDFGRCRKNYLWFGSDGLVLKGLDIVLETFAAMPDYRLYVCGPVAREKDFEALYYDELYRTPNITTAGWVDVRGQGFRDIADDCLGVVFPSASEGQSGSVVQCLHAGLIPVISRPTGIDAGGFGVMLRELTVEEVRSAISNLSGAPEESLRSLSRKSWEYARARHTRERFTARYTEIVSDLLRTREARS